MLLVARVSEGISILLVCFKLRIFMASAAVMQAFVCLYAHLIYLCRKERNLDVTNHWSPGTLEDSAATEHKLLTLTNRHLSEYERDFFSRWFSYISHELEESEKTVRTDALWRSTEAERFIVILLYTDTDVL